MGWWRERLDKTTVANVCAGVTVLVGVAFAAITKNVEMIKTYTLLGFGYLFGRLTVPST